VEKTPTLALDDKARRLIDAMILVEQRHLAERRSEEACACKEGLFPRKLPTSRRSFLFAAGSTAGAVLAGAANAGEQKAPPGAQFFEAPLDPTKELGRAVAADGGYGSRSQFEAEVRWRFPTANEYTSWSMSPLDKMVGNLTPSGLHFERHHGGIPTIDPSRHIVFVHGMVQGG
jgi:sulfane dehydrogenase subunit SoxC